MDIPIDIFEGYPDHILASLEKRDRQRRASLPPYISEIGLELVMEDLKLWQVGKLIVSFKGGNNGLHQKIAEVAMEWSKYGNIQFDFGFNQADNKFRQWIPGDTSHIRVGFEHPGYWSLVGTDSNDIAVVPQGEITLNLSSFDKQLPQEWQATVLHEFGHALGFHHEHQSPAAKCDFDWEKLYVHLAGSPNFWNRAKVDHNLRELPGGGITYSPHDKESIMHYSFPAWMFKNGEHSNCFIQKNNALSARDKQMAEQAYPKTKSDFEKQANIRISNLQQILNSPDLKNDSIRAYFNKHLDFIESDTHYNNFF